MKINKAIRQVMKAKNVTLSTMASALGKSRSNDISARLAYDNMTVIKAIEMLNVLGYEMVIQEKRQGSRRADQIVIDQLDYDLNELLKGE